MGVIRKTLSISTLGIINFRSKRERTVRAVERDARSNARVAEAEARLLDAQREALVRGQQ